MNRTELVICLAEKAKVPRKTAEMVVSAMFDAMTDALASGDRIEIRGFGSFTSKEYGSYMGRNPRTGETVYVTNKRQPLFKAGKELKERVDQLGELFEEPSDYEKP